MNKVARIKKRLILLIAFSVMWVFIGSLVIFHQEQVMGKTFKWHKISFVVPKSKDEKSASKLLVKNSQDHGHPVILAVLDENQREQLLEGHYSLLPRQVESSFIPGFFDLIIGLRAPPLA